MSQQRLCTSTLLALFFSAGVAHAAPNLLTNGSFEIGAFVNQGNVTMSLAAGSTAITGWTVVTDTAAWIGPSNPWSLSANEGDYFLDLSNYQPGGPFARVQQVITTIPGATYALSFDLGGSNRWGRPDSISASAVGTSTEFITPSTGTNNDWYHHSMEFVANSASTVVLLQGLTGNNYIGLDNAAVELVSSPVPIPQAWILLSSGLLIFGAAARRTLQ